MVRSTSKNASRRHAFIILSVLVAMNAGIASMLVKQIVFRSNAQSEALVKDASVTAADADPLPTTNAAPEASALGTDSDTLAREGVTTYMVKNGDTLGGIASNYGISTDTIRWANSIEAKTALKPGDTLTILPVTGVLYKVARGDTISGIAAKFDASQAEILHYNNLEDAGAIKVGMELVIPDASPLGTASPAKKPAVIAEKKVAAKAPVKVSVSKPTPASVVTNTAAAIETVVEKKDSQKVSEEKDTVSVKIATPVATVEIEAPKSKGYSNPIPGSILTQGTHGANSVDFGAPVGTTVRASASGTVKVAKGDNGWGGGYGNYIVIQHADGTETLYAHLSSVGVSVGESVSQGDTIGKSGNTGRSTGPHLHFEVHGASNPFAKTKVGTHL